MNQDKARRIAGEILATSEANMTDTARAVDRYMRSAEDRHVRSCKLCRRWQVDYRLEQFRGPDELQAFLEKLFEHHITYECPGAS